MCPPFSYCRSCNVLFLLRQEKYQKKATKGDIPKRHVIIVVCLPPASINIINSLRGAPPLKKPLRRLASQRPKMFRFLNAYIEQCFRFFLRRYPKIGTFSGIGWKCGWGYQRGRIFVAPLWPHSLVTFLFRTRKYDYRTSQLSRSQIFAQIQ